MSLIVLLLYTKSGTLHLFRICFFGRAMTWTVNPHRGLNSILHHSTAIYYGQNDNGSNDCNRAILL